MNADEAIRDLLSISADITHVALLDADGEVVAAGPGAVAADLGAAAGRLWEAAGRRAQVLGEAPLDHVVIGDAAGAVAVLESNGRRAAALTGPWPAAGLLVFDLRTCLSDAFGDEGRA